MDQVEVKYAPGMRIIVRGEEWMVKKVETNSLGNQTLHVIGISQLVKDYESMFLVDVEDDIEIVDPAKVKGDARIMEILVKKEEQALKNIGDPAMLFGKFNQEEEEEETAKVIESGAGAAAFEKLLDSDEEEFDPLELLMGLGDEKEVKVEYSDEETLFSDIDYLKNLLFECF